MDASPSISFCLFGPDPRYTHGLLRNIELAPTIYPGWQLHCWLGDGIPQPILDQLRALPILLHPCPNLNPMLARFLINDEPGVSRYLVRDTDSRLNPRERHAVEEWLASPLPFHLIRDHPGHQVPIPGGLWGGTPGHFSMRSLLDSWPNPTRPGPRNQIYNQDQLFLSDKLWPLISTRILQHDFCNRDLFPAAKPFPARFGDWRFVGEIFDAADQPEPYGWQRRINWMEPEEAAA